MAQNIIQKLRQKPKAVRDNIALGVAGAFTSLLVFAWFMTSTNQLSEVVDGSKQGVSAFSTFITHIKGEVASVAESLPDKEEFTKAASSSLQQQVSEQIHNNTPTATTTQQRAVIRIATTTASSSAVVSSSTTVSN